MSAICRLLEWDSDLFGRRIGRVALPALDAESAAAAVAWAERERLDCLYLLADAADAVTIGLAEAHGFELKDLRVTLARQGPAPTAATLAGAEIRPARPGDLPALEALARASFHDTRFFFDRRFDPAAAAELYAIWVRQSCAGQADAVHVAADASGACGFLTCVLRGDVGQIGLVAVEARARGRGLGAALVDAGLRWFADHSATRVEVVTQGRNIVAQRLYQRAGFLTEAVQLWYHRWFAHGPADGASRSEP
jgi:dTDP-4-amino-4,6-dideoxy-D-galactose acyltransferase